MALRALARPDWDRLYEAAAGQEGLFTTKQALDAGFSTALLAHHVLRSKRIVKVARRLYRLAHFPLAEHEEFVSAWLWSEQAGTFSHRTALALHGLSDVLPARLHMTLPSAWRRRRLQIPQDVILHFADIPEEDRAWHGVVPLTSVRRTLVDCALDDLSPDLLAQAVRQARRRGLVADADLGRVYETLGRFGDTRHGE